MNLGKLFERYLLFIEDELYLLTCLGSWSEREKFASGKSRFWGNWFGRCFTSDSEILGDLSDIWCYVSRDWSLTLWMNSYLVRNRHLHLRFVILPGSTKSSGIVSFAIVSACICLTLSLSLTIHAKIAR